MVVQRGLMTRFPAYKKEFEASAGVDKVTRIARVVEEDVFTVSFFCQMRVT